MPDLGLPDVQLLGVNGNEATVQMGLLKVGVKLRDLKRA